MEIDTMTPEHLGLPEKFSDFRSVQIEAIESISQSDSIFITLHDGYAGSCVEVTVPPWGFIHHKVYIIQLSERIPCGHSFRYRRYSESLLRFYIAHELAHAYLNAYLELVDVISEDEREAMADEVAEGWGFGLPGIEAERRAERRKMPEGSVKVPAEGLKGWRHTR